MAYFPVCEMLAWHLRKKHLNPLQSGGVVSTSSAKLLSLRAPVTILDNRWVQLTLGVVCMMAISSPQYVWALLTKPMLAAFGVKLSQLQVTFSILIVFQTFLSPVQGYLIDRFGPRLLLSIGGALTGRSEERRV